MKPTRKQRRFSREATLREKEKAKLPPMPPMPPEIRKIDLTWRNLADQAQKRGVTVPQKVKGPLIKAIRERDLEGTKKHYRVFIEALTRLETERSLDP